MGLELFENFGKWEFRYAELEHNNSVYETFWKGVELIESSPFQAEIIFKKLIEDFPYFIDAYNSLSTVFKSTSRSFESRLTAEKSYSIGRKAFPKDFNPQMDKLKWDILRNRPFLRACQIYGIELQDSGDHPEAIAIFDEGLHLNPTDNQGLRYLKLQSLYYLNDLAGVEWLLKNNEEDWSVEFLYGRTNLEILKGDYENALKALQKSREINEFLPDIIIKPLNMKEHQTLEVPYHEFGAPQGSKQEALEHWDEYKFLYGRKEIIAFYKKHV